MKKKMKTRREEEYFNFKDLIFSKKKHFGNIFAQDASLAELKIDFRKIFVKASSSQNLEFFAGETFHRRILFTDDYF